MQNETNTLPFTMTTYHRLTRFAFLFIFVSICGFKALHAQGPSIRYLSPKDSLFLTVEQEQKVVHHLVKPKQTLFSLAKFYGLSLDELYRFNPDFQTNPALKAGTLVRIPVPNRAIKRYKTAGFLAANHTPIYYVVQPGDNFYQICKRYFKTPLDTVAVRNRLKDVNIRPGQRLLVGWMGIEGIPPEWRPVRKATPYDHLHRVYNETKAARRERQGQGICYWQSDSREHGEMYALHREAAIGTVMGITNPATGKVGYAKVIGRIPSNYQHHIEVIVPPALARYVGAKEAEFFVRVKFFR